MYPTLIALLFNVKLFIICLYFCFVNLIWWCYIPGGKYIKRWYSIMICG